MKEENQFDTYVRRRLDAWGREFAFHRDFELLGHRSKDMLQVLIEHKGEMPPPNVGFKPLTIPPEPMQIEDVVRGIYRDASHLAVVLRAYYCGRGRHGVERLEQACQMLGERIPRRQYYLYHDLGFHRVAGSLRFVEKAA